MTTKEITALRKEGKLEEALLAVSQLLQEDPDNIWNKRAASWIYYDYLKTNASFSNYAIFIENLTNINNLNLPEEEIMLFDNCVWPINKIIFSLIKNDLNFEEKIINLFEIFKDFMFSKPSETYSILLNACHKGLKDSNKYIHFINWWNLDNLRLEDFQQSEYNDRKIISIAEQVYDNYAKKLIEVSEKEFSTDIDERINDFLPKISNIIEKHPDYKYVCFYKAKLLLALNDKEKAFTAFLPFAKQKQNEFWIWSLFAKIFSNDKELQLACYCKSLSIKNKEEFFVKTRLEFAKILIKNKFYNEAKTEITKIIYIREKKQWKIPNIINIWESQDWYKKADANKNNNSFYDTHKDKAEEILYKDLEEEIVIIDYVNNVKRILNFIKNENKKGFFKYQGFLKNPQVGDLLKVRLDQEEEGGEYYTVRSISKPLNDDICEAVKDFSGNIRIPNNHSFGFVDNVFIDENTIKNNNFIDNQEIQGRAILSFNKKKQIWGWKILNNLKE